MVFIRVYHGGRFSAFVSLKEMGGPCTHIHEASKSKSDWDYPHQPVLQGPAIDVTRGPFMVPEVPNLRLAQSNDLLPETTYKEASQKLTDIYRNVIFRDDNEEEWLNEIQGVFTTSRDILTC
jgi:hypothetical protein